MNKKNPVRVGWSDVLFATPVVLVSTKSPEGVDNVAPFGMVMPISSDPPLIAIGVHSSRDTYRYIKENREFAINFLSPTQKQECLLTARSIPPQELEYERVAEKKSERIKANLERLNLYRLAKRPGDVSAITSGRGTQRANIWMHLE